MACTWKIIWISQYGREVVDETRDKANAEYLRKEYALAFKEGSVIVKRGIERE